MNLAEQETPQAVPEAAELAPTEVPPAGEKEAASDAQSEAGEGEDTGELVVSIGEEAPPQTEEQSAPAWVRDLRKQNRELTKRLKELEAKERQPAQPALPPKPTLESCDWDEAKFADAVVEWNNANRQAELAQEEKRKAEEAQQIAAQKRIDAYHEAKAKMPADDMEEAEATVGAMLNPVQQQILIHGAKNPALLILALGKYPEKAKQLAAITDLAEFAFTAARMELEVKTSTRKATVAPEKPMTGTAAVGVGGGDTTLERLRAEALKTGDMTKVVAYRRQQRNGN